MSNDDAPDAPDAPGVPDAGDAPEPRTWADRTSARASDALEAVGDAAELVAGRVAAAGERASIAVDRTAVALHVPIPFFRGLLHLVAALGAIAAGVVMVVHARHAPEIVATAIFSAGLLLTFATSATYHRTPLRWKRMRARMQKADHSMIFVLIVSSFTAFDLLAMEGSLRWIGLSTMWGIAAIGIAIRWLWNDVPRRILALTYLVLGWGCAVYSPWMAPHVSIAPGALVLASGLLYSVGAIVYMRKRPNPSPRVFGFHEVFHAFTIAAATCQWIAVWMLLS